MPAEGRVAVGPCNKRVVYLAAICQLALWLYRASGTSAVAPVPPDRLLMQALWQQTSVAAKANQSTETCIAMANRCPMQPGQQQYGIQGGGGAHFGAQLVVEGLVAPTLVVLPRNVRHVLQERLHRGGAICPAQQSAESCIATGANRFRPSTDLQKLLQDHAQCR